LQQLILTLVIVGGGCFIILELWLVQFSSLSRAGQSSGSADTTLSRLSHPLATTVAAAYAVSKASASAASTVNGRGITNEDGKKQVGTTTTTGRTSASSLLPQWIQDYVAWHGTMRRQFPGRAIFDDPDAPPLLIRTCLGLCGGLNDRLGQLPWDIYLANQTGRVLLLHWHRPVPLEHFLLPGTASGRGDNDDTFLLDWRVPPTVPGFFPPPSEVRVSREGMKAGRTIPELFAGYEDAAPPAEFWRDHLDRALARATTGEYRSHRVLRHRLLGHLNEHDLEERLRELGETDMIHNTASFGLLFRLFFRPSPNVQVAVDRVYEQLQLRPQQFGAVHVRVRHPKATPKNVNVKGKNEDYPADKTGLPWTGATKAFAIAVATRAVQCARRHFVSSSSSPMPLYFYSDSNDLVRYMVFEQQQQQPNNNNERMSSDLLVARHDYDQENAHIDKQKGRDPQAYYNTFVDLWVAADAQCLAMGVGNFALLAAKISATPCKVLYQKEAWGSHDGSSKFQQDTTVCDLPDV
jgi:hypothetical protein